MIAAAVLVLAIASVLQPPSPDAILAKLDQYLAAYEPKLSELIADERLTQELRQSRGVRADNVTPMESRARLRLESEVAFIALPKNAGWLGFRHVQSVNGQAVPEADVSLTSLLQAEGYAAARALLNSSAKHNLGLPRTTNLPNLPLEFLHARNRDRLLARLDGRESVRGEAATRVVLLERTTPTLIRNPETNADMPSVVRAWVHQTTGQLLRAEILTFPSFEAKEAANTIRVEFALNKPLGLLVPVEMRETFAADQPRPGTGVASYSNFRKFQTSARIVPQ